MQLDFSPLFLLCRLGTHSIECVHFFYLKQQASVRDVVMFHLGVKPHSQPEIFNPNPKPDFL